MKYPQIICGAILAAIFLCNAGVLAQEKSPIGIQPELINKAESGDAFSQYRLAGEYESANDLVSAAKWYGKSADQGESHAQNALAFLYEKGLGVPQSYTEAVKWYRKSADQGNPNGQSNLAMMYAHGTGVQQDLKQAVELYRKSAEQGWAWGQAMLAEMLAKGKAADKIEAYAWCELAFTVEDRGGGWGCKELLHGLASEMKPGEIADAKKRAFKWFQDRSADPKQRHWPLGPTDAVSASGILSDEEVLTGGIGMAFALGEVVPVDDQEAIRWYQLGAERGDALAESHLGERYYLGKGVAKDPARAFSLFQHSAEQGWQWGQHNLATCYIQGIGVSTDTKEAIHWFEMAGAQGNSSSLHDLGGIFAMGQGVEKDYAAAFKWLLLARAAGDTDQGLYAVGAQLTQKQMEQAQQQAAAWLTAHSNVLHFRTELAYMYWRGEGVRKDFAEAARRGLQAAKDGDPRAVTLMGILYSSGEGVEKNEFTAAKLFLAAAEQGDRVAQTFTGMNYEQGRGVPKSEAEALKWYQKAVAHEDADSTAFNNLAWLYATAGDTALRDPIKALHYARKAVALDNETDAGNLDTLAEAYFVNGDYENAVATEKKALALQPDNEGLKKSLKKYEAAQKQKQH